VRRPGTCRLLAPSQTLAIELNSTHSNPGLIDGNDEFYH
jgi:hypothetical protein